MITNKHKFENRLTDEVGNMLWFKIYLLEEVMEYEKYENLVLEKLKQLPEYSDLLCITLIIRSVFKNYTETILEVKTENEKKKQYVEYMDKEIYALEHYFYNPYENVVEIYSKINNDYIENKSIEFQREFEDLKSPEIIRRERKLKKEVS